MINRVQPEAPPTLVLTKLEIRLLDRLSKAPPYLAAVASASCYLSKLARLGGYLARGRDPLPGNQVIWRGMSRLTDIELGYLLAKENVGN